jgi:hypothetical protein
MKVRHLLGALLLGAYGFKAFADTATAKLTLTLSAQDSSTYNSQNINYFYTSEDGKSIEVTPLAGITCTKTFDQDPLDRENFGSRKLEISCTIANVNPAQLKAVNSSTPNLSLSYKQAVLSIITGGSGRGLSFKNVKNEEHKLSFAVTSCSGGSKPPPGATSCPKNNAVASMQVFPTTCEAGFYSQAKARSCTKCAAGSYSSANARSCTKCPGGSYASAAGARSCTKCPDDSITNNLVGSTSCTKCPPGQKPATKNSTKCMLQNMMFHAPFLGAPPQFK